MNNFIYNKSFVCTKFSVFKYCYVSLAIQLNMSFVYTQLNVKTVLFQTIQFSIITQFKCKRVLVDPYTGPNQELPLRVRVDLGAKAMKGNLASPKLPHYWSFTIGLFNIIPRTLVGGILLFYRDAVGVFCSPKQLGQTFYESSLMIL